EVAARPQDRIHPPRGRAPRAHRPPRGARLRLRSDRAALGCLQAAAHRRLLGCARIRGGTEAARRHRRGRDRTRARERVAPARSAGRGAGSAAGLPAVRRPAARPRGAAALQEARSRYPPRHQGHGRCGEMNYNVIPSVIYTAPEIAWVGLTEEQVKASGREYKSGVFPFLASGRARALEQPAGFAKIVAARDDDEILGVHIVGPMAGELIAEAVLAMEYAASSEDLQRTIHAHPTLAEAVHEAALATDKRSIDAINR